jgi:MFS transporter, MCT family, aspergillic acid transporter
MGLVAAGSSIGGIVWPIMINSLLKKVGFGWTLRACGLLAFVLLSIANILVVEREGLRGTGARARAQMKLEGVPMAFTEPRYMLLAAAFFFVYFGMFIPYYYLPTYGMAHGMSPKMSSYLIAILNAGSFFGRVGCGWLSDKFGR